MPFRPPPKRRDDLFFVGMVAVILAANAIGFARSYYLAGVFRAPLPSLVVHLHAALFTSWLLLLMVQTLLVSTGNVRIHRKLGLLGGIIAAMMLIVGPLVLEKALSRHAFKTEGGAAFLLTADAGGLLLFAIFVMCGLLRRSDSIRHKRMMLFATIAILGPALSRWSFHFMDWPPAIFLLWLAFPLAMITFDIVSTGKPYRITVVGSLSILIFLISVGPISGTHGVRRLTRALEGTTIPAKLK